MVAQKTYKINKLIEIFFLDFLYLVILVVLSDCVVFANAVDRSICCTESALTSRHRAIANRVIHIE